MNLDKFPDLVRKLKEIFQIDKPELDFGVYRILNARRCEIEDFLDNRFKARVKAALGDAATENAAATLAAARAKVEATLGAAAIAPDGSIEPAFAATPAGAEYEAARNAAATASASGDAESLVYAHLLAFFSRYYEDGDFISQRRYKEGVYAIPYSGEEVKLHWANSDQYYTKTGEAFINYDFPLDGGLRVRFRLVSADTAKDNIKDNEAERRFVLWDPATKPEIESDDEDAIALAEEKYPADFIEEKNGELIIYFQYLKFPKNTKKKDLLDAAEAAITGKMTGGTAFSRWVSVLAPDPDNSKRTILRRHLDRYAAKNTSDYFIHKDLGKFLRRELDFYVKNEMVNLDEVESVDFDHGLAPRLRTIRAFRAVAKELIDFMAQLEDFQKKLWLKKKFVVQCDWCMTLDIVEQNAPELLAEIFTNDKQKEEWKNLGVDADPKTVELTALDSRMVDTKFFPESFKAKLLAAIPDLDAHTDGVLVHSENFQALRLIKDRCKGLVKCIYIDPPYNSKTSEILYKNTYRDSSWLSLMMNRLTVSRKIGDIPIIVAIDENEQEVLSLILKSLYPTYDNTSVSVVHNKKGIQGNYFHYCHEFALFCIPPNYPELHGKPIPEDKWEYSNLRKWGRESDRSTAKNCFYPIFVRDETIVGFGDVCAPSEHPSEANIVMPDGRIAVYPIETGSATEKKWRYERNTVESILPLLKVVRTRSGEVQIHKAKPCETVKTVWSDSRYIAGDYGTKWLTDLGIKVSESLYPKSLFTVEDSIVAVSESESTTLDYFGGSGTTAHAVIDLNRQDREKGVDAKRKYILVEMGEHFDTVLKPRIEKVVYSTDWKAGKPQNAGKGISHCFKYLTLESYEDTLNNLEMKKPDGAQAGLAGLTDPDEYLLRYMLDVEARGSILSTDAFLHPFDYEMKIAADSSGASVRRKIDLVETFNWLLGLRVESEERRIERGVVLVEGTLPSGKTALVCWRDCDKVDSAALTELLRVQGYITAGDGRPAKGRDIIYVNGDHALKSIVASETGDMNVRSIEEEFLSKMWEEK